MKKSDEIVLTIDAGGIKAIYSVLIIDGIEEKFKLNFNSNFNYYVGTSIGGVIAAALAYGVTPKDMLLQISTFKRDFHKGHIYLINKLFGWIDYLFGRERLFKIKTKLFLPVYNFSSKELTFFSNNSERDNDLSIAEILKAACSDIRIVKPYKINKLNLLFADAGFFAYDPIVYFLRSKQVELNAKLKILSIGSGLIENISNDLSLGQEFDTIYDAFLYDQFRTTSFLFEILVQKYRVNYFRISEFPSSHQTISSIAKITKLAEKKLLTLAQHNFDIFSQVGWVE